MKQIIFTIFCAVVIAVSGFAVMWFADRYAGKQLETQTAVAADNAGNLLLTENNAPVLYDWKDYTAQTKVSFEEAFGKEELYGDATDSMGVPEAFLNAVYLGVGANPDIAPTEDLTNVLEEAQVSEDGRTLYLKDYAYQSVTGKTMAVSFVVQDSVAVYFNVQEEAQTAQEQTFSQEQIQAWKTSYEKYNAEFTAYAKTVQEVGGVSYSDETMQVLYSTENPIVRFWGTQAEMLEYYGIVSALPLYVEPSEQDILFSGGKIYHTMLFLAKDITAVQEEIEKDQVDSDYAVAEKTNILSYFQQSNVRITTVYNPITNRIEGFRLQM